MPSRTPSTQPSGTLARRFITRSRSKRIPVNQLESFTELCADMDAGKVDTLLIFGSNPVYDAPHDFDFTSKLQKVATSVLVSTHFDETAEYCKWHVAESHFLETWGDARAFDGTVSVIQPLIAPLYHTHSAFDVLAAFTDKPGLTAYDAVRDRLKASAGAADPEKFWRKTLNDGVVANSAYARRFPLRRSSVPRACRRQKRFPRGSSNLFSARMQTSTTAATQTTAGCRNWRGPSPKLPGITPRWSVHAWRKSSPLRNAPRLAAVSTARSLATLSTSRFQTAKSPRPRGFCRAKPKT